MKYKFRSFLLVSITLLFFITAGAVWAAKYDPLRTNQVPALTGDEFPDYLISSARGVLWEHCDADSIISPYDTVIGCTSYGHQHICRIPRMNANDYQELTGGNGRHYCFMHQDSEGRHVNYAYWDPLSDWVDLPAQKITRTSFRAGYAGIDVFRPLPGYFKFHSRPVVCYHASEPVYPNLDEHMGVALSIERNIPGAREFFWYDIPDSIVGSSFKGIWPACAVDSLNRIHVVMMEGSPYPFWSRHSGHAGFREEPGDGIVVRPPGGYQLLGYVRCEERSGDSLMCWSPGKDSVTLDKETQYFNPLNKVYAFDKSGFVSPLVVTSKVSNKVAICWLALAESESESTLSKVYKASDVFYIESTNGGDDWFTAGDFPERVNVTKYNSRDMVRAYGEVSAVYDLRDSLHIFWHTHWYNPATEEFDAQDVGLWHWSKATQRICGSDTIPANKVHHAKWEAYPGVWNSLISKIQSGIGTLEGYNKNYLYVQWTQFDPLKESTRGYTQGDIYITVSTNDGFTWNVPVNVTNSTVPDCEPGECASDHWSSMAERVDSCVYMQWIYDLDAGGFPEYEGVATDNPVLVYAFDVDSIPIEDKACIAWNPDGWFDPPISIPKNGVDTVELILENPGTKTLHIYNITDDAGWLEIGPYPDTIGAGCCPAKVKLYIAGVNADTFLVGTVTVNSNDDVGNGIVSIKVHVVESDEYVAWAFAEVENPTYVLSLSNTGNQANQEDEAGFYLKEDQVNFLYDGSPIVGWIEPDNDTLVGRYVFDERYLVAATDLSVDTSNLLQTIVAETEFWPVRIQIPPADQDWPFWRLKMKKYLFFSNDSSSAHPFVDNKNEQYVALVSLEAFHDEPPNWWVDVTPPGTIPDAYLGMAFDIDCPSVSGAVNYRGNDTTWRYAYIQGFGYGNEDYRMAVGQVDSCFEFGPDSFACWPFEIYSPFEDFWGMHVLRNDSVVYPRGGYVDAELYTWMTTSGYIMQPGPGEDADYNIVASGGKIPSHSWDPDSDKVWGVAYVEAVSDKFELASLDTLVRMCRCGNANRDLDVGVTDVSAMINFLLKGTGDGIWTFMSDVNGDGKVDLVDVSYLIFFLLRSSGKPPMCSYLK